MKEQIEEMAKIIHGYCKGNCANCFPEACGDYLGAEALYNAGYRKQKEERPSKGCEYCKGRAYTKKPLTVITKYGRNIELVFEFCPNCGRKMKGGAE